jgi:hypothetical protein
MQQYGTVVVIAFLYICFMLLALVYYRLSYNYYKTGLQVYFQFTFYKKNVHIKCMSYTHYIS